VRFSDTLPEEDADPIPAAGRADVDAYLNALAEQRDGDGRRKTQQQTRLNEVRKARKAGAEGKADQKGSDVPRSAQGLLARLGMWRT
jgi:hypothetical protein